MSNPIDSLLNATVAASGANGAILLLVYPDGTLSMTTSHEAPMPALRELFCHAIGLSLDVDKRRLMEADDAIAAAEADIKAELDKLAEDAADGE